MNWSNKRAEGKGGFASLFQTARSWPALLSTIVRAMRATPSFRFFVPAFAGLLVGLLSALTLFLIPASFPGTTIWSRVREVYNQLHYPASLLAAAWRSAGLPPHAEGALGVCAIVVQWLLLGTFAGAIWLYIGRLHATTLGRSMTHTKTIAVALVLSILIGCAAVFIAAPEFAKGRYRLSPFLFPYAFLLRHLIPSRQLFSPLILAQFPAYGVFSALAWRKGRQTWATTWILTTH